MVAPVSGFETGQTAGAAVPDHQAVGVQAGALTHLVGNEATVVHEVEHLDAVFEDHHVGDEAPVTRAANSSRSRRP